MALQGPFYPVTVATEIGAVGANDWLTPGNISADDAAEAQITAATFDANDHSYRLKATNFGFTIPTGATIDGIVVEIDRRAFAGGANDHEVRLYDSAGALVGADKASATAWPTTSTVATYGGIADTWTASPTVAMVNSAAFGVALIAHATAANTDIGVDFIRVTVYYTAASSGPITATPGAASLTTTTFAPAVTASNHQTVVPGVASLTTSTFAPTVAVSDHKVATPPTVALSTATFAPTVAVSANQVATPGTASLALSAFAPTVATSDHKTVVPGLATLSLTAFAPTVTVVAAGVTVTPGVAALSTAVFAPTVSASDHQTVTPALAALTTSAFAPVISTSNHQTVAASAAALAMTAFAPNVVASDHKLVTPAAAAVSLTTFAPTVTAAGAVVIGGWPPVTVGRGRWLDAAYKPE